jgi:hypothetical protein
MQLFQKYTSRFLSLFITMYFVVLNTDAQIVLNDSSKQMSTKYTSNHPISVGYTDLDDDIRNLQLLGKISAKYSLTNRPFYTNTFLNYGKIINLIDTNLKGNHGGFHRKYFDIQLLPVNVSFKYNSHHPYGWNDGPLNFSKGLQKQYTGGIYLRILNLNIQVKPEMVDIQPKPYEIGLEWLGWGYFSPPIKKIYFGQSFTSLNLGPFALGLSNQNVWWGPGKYSALIMTNNAPGFIHKTFRTTRPIVTKFGNFEFNIISGGDLKYDSAQGLETWELKKKIVKNGPRVFNGVNLVYQPKFLPNLFFGFNRVFVDYTKNKYSSFLQKNIPQLLPFTKKSYSDDSIFRNQLLSIYTKWLFPRSNAEAYLEFGFEDASINLRDLMLDFSHSAAFIVGFKKIQKLQNEKYLDINYEYTKIANSPSLIQRGASGVWYSHLIIEGYTNYNQIMGAGSGFGNNLQTFEFNYNNKFNRIGIKLQHIIHNPMIFANPNPQLLGLRKVYWNDYSLGLGLRARVYKFLIDAKVENVFSKNYLWKQNNNTFNLFGLLNMTYIW